MINVGGIRGVVVGLQVEFHRSQGGEGHTLWLYRMRGAICRISGGKNGKADFLFCKVVSERLEGEREGEKNDSTWCENFHTFQVP